MEHDEIIANYSDNVNNTLNETIPERGNESLHDEKVLSLAKDYVEYVQSTDVTTLVGVVVAIVAVLVTIVIILVRRLSTSRQTVLIVGLCNAGKSLIFSQLIHGKYIDTHTSMTENNSSYNVGREKKSSLRLIDVPGHDRVRQLYFDKFKDGTRGIIFVVDSSEFQKEMKDVAELLYSILSDKIIARNGISLLVACNKSDQGRAKGSRLIHSALEKELNNVRKTHLAALQGTDGGMSQAVYIGRRDKDLTFADVRNVTVNCVECSASSQNGELGCDLKCLQDWLSQLD